MDYDCSKLLVDFTECPAGVKLIDHFNELKAYQEFVQQQDDNIIKIAILTSDKDSPFWKLRGDREIMIRSIFEFLDIGTMNLMGKEFIKKVLTFKHEGVAECWLAYLQMQYSIDFTDWCISKETYDMLIAESARPKDDKEDAVAYANWRIKLRNQIRILGDDLKQLEPKIFPDSKIAQVVAIEQVKKIKNYAEKYGRKFEGFNA